MNVPLQSSCRADVPSEHALWALPGIAGPTARAPLVLPRAVMEAWSEHLWECGFRHHPELQKIKYLPPGPNTNWLQGAAGQWVPIDQPLTAEQSAPDTDHLTADEKRVLIDRLTTELAPDTAPAPEDTAETHHG